MTFANPLALWLLAALPALVLFHFYRVRRDIVRVSAPSLWTPDPAARGTPQPAWRNFRWSWLLALQVLAVLAAVLALANLTITREASGWPRIAIVLDTSASMRATDVPGGRFEAARAQAQALVAALAPGQQALIMTTEPRLVQPFGADLEALAAALATIEPNDRGSGLASALRAVEAMLGKSPPTLIHVLTDPAGAAETDGVDDTRRGAEPTSQPTVELPGAVQWHVMGASAENVAITDSSFRRASGGPRSAYELFVALENFGTSRRALRFRLDLDDSVLLDERLTVPAHTRRNLVLPFAHERGGVLRAHIQLEDDALQRDNSVSVTLPAPRERRIALVGAGNLFLEEALRASPFNRLEVARSVPAAGGAEHDAVVRAKHDIVARAKHDVVVLDRRAPSRLAPGRYLVIGALPEHGLLEALPEQSLPPIVDWDRAHPITRNLDFSRVVVQQAIPVRPRQVGVGSALVESDVGPLVYAWDDGTIKAVYIGFDLFRSDLRVRTAFPLLVDNALDWLDAVALDKMDLEPDVLGAEESNISPRGQRAEANTTPAPPGYEYVWQPWRWLVIAAVLALLVEAAVFQARRRKALIPLLPRVVVLVLLIAAVLDLEWRGTTDRRNVAFVLDRSASVPDRAAIQAAADIAKVLDREPDRADERTRAIALEYPVRLDRANDSSAPPSAPDTALARRTSGGAAPGTDLAHLVHAAILRLPAEGDRRVVLVSDGRQTRGDVLAAARTAKALGIAVDTVPVGGIEPEEHWLEALHVPAHTRAGEAFAVHIVAFCQSASTARLVVTRNGELLADQSVTLRAGKNVLRFVEVADRAGYAVYEARLEGDADATSENNWAMGAIAVHGRPRLLVLESDPSRLKYLSEVLAAQQIDVDVRTQAEFSAALDRLSDYDAVALSNVSSLDLSAEEMQRIHGYVHDEGGGLLMLGGDQSFGLGGYYQTPIEAALPVSMVVKQKLDVPSTSVVLVLDRSGSMSRADGELNRLEIAKEAAQRAVELLSERTELGVLAFDMRSDWVLPIGPLGDKAGALRSIATLTGGGGGTQLMWALTKAYRGIAKRTSIIRHVIILSDGEVYDSKFPDLIANMVDKKITVSAVTIGSPGGISQLQQISELGQGRFYYAVDATQLPQIFTMETQLAAKSALIEEPFEPIVLGRFHEVLQGVDIGSIPPLDGYVATTAKPAAETVIVSPRDDPILSVWRYGLGRSAAFTSEITSRWAERWLDWKALGPMLAQLVRWNARRTRDHEVRVSARIHAPNDDVPGVSADDEKGEVWVEAVDSSGARRNFLNGEISIVQPDKRTARATLIQTAPGLYRARFSAMPEGAYLMSVAMRDGEALALQSEVSAVKHYASEFRARPVNRRLLGAIAEASGGRVLARVDDVFSAPRRVSEAMVALWPWLLLAATIGLVLDLAHRWWWERRLAGTSE